MPKTFQLFFRLIFLLMRLLGLLHFHPISSPNCFFMIFCYLIECEQSCYDSIGYFRICKFLPSFSLK